jgi:hypothetical protein
MPEFIAYKPLKNPSKEFLTVVEHLKPEEQVKLAWPENTKTAKAIFAILTNKSIAPVEIYKQLEGIKTLDLRPHLLMLLNGFEEENIQYKIDSSLFETLHFWVEAKLCKPYITAIEVRSIGEDLSWMQLTNTQANAFKVSMKDDAIKPAEKIAFRFVVDNKMVLKRMIITLLAIAQFVEDKKLYKVQSVIKENLKFLKQCADVYSLQPVRELIKKFEFWLECLDKQRTITQKLEGKIIDPTRYPPELSEYVLNTKDILQWVTLYTSQFQLAQKQNSSILNSLLAYDTCPLLNYIYDKKANHWYFIFLGNAGLKLYSLSIGLNPSDMINVYGKISPYEISDAFITNKPRLGNFMPRTLENNTIVQHLHGVASTLPFEGAFHDRYHQMILSAMPPELRDIMTRCLKMIQEKTNIKLSKEIWDFVDTDFSSLFLTPDFLSKLQYILLYAHPVLKTAIIVDILSHDFYGRKIDFSKNTHLFELYKIQKNFPDFEDFQKKLKLCLNNTNIDIFIATWIYVNVNLKLNNAAPLFLANASHLSYRFEICKEKGYDKNTIQFWVSFHNKPFKKIEDLTTSDLASSASANIIISKYGEIFRKQILKDSDKFSVKPYTAH